jgi:hypothetical protein
MAEELVEAQSSSPSRLRILLPYTFSANFTTHTFQTKDIVHELEVFPGYAEVNFRPIPAAGVDNFIRPDVEQHDGEIELIVAIEFQRPGIMIKKHDADIKTGDDDNPLIWKLEELQQVFSILEETHTPKRINMSVLMEFRGNCLTTEKRMKIFEWLYDHNLKESIEVFQNQGIWGGLIAPVQWRARKGENLAFHPELDARRGNRTPAYVRKDIEANRVLILHVFQRCRRPPPNEKKDWPLSHKHKNYCCIRGFPRQSKETRLLPNNPLSKLKMHAFNKVNAFLGGSERMR